MAAQVNRARRSLLTWRNVERIAIAILWLALVVASALGYWGREDWRLDLFANFKMQYYLVALLLCAIAAWRRFRVLLGLCLLVVLWNGFEIFNFAPQSSDGDGKVYRALSANVFTQNGQIERVEAWIRQQEPDFVALIEITGAWEPTLDRLKDILPYQRKEMWGQRYGAVVLSRYPPLASAPGVSNYVGVGNVPFPVMTPDGPLWVVLMHPQAPTSPRAWEWRGNALRDLAIYSATASEHTPVLVMGDMNTTPWSSFYRDFVMESELHPVATSFLPRRTWPTRNPLLWIPIDHFFLSDELSPVTQWTGADLGSDHYPIGLDFHFAPQKE